jgi:hypothetical protein
MLGAGNHTEPGSSSPLVDFCFVTLLPLELPERA